jgi:hypothetical protein
MPHRPHDLAEAFRQQAGYCDALGSPLWAHMMRHAARDIDDGGPVARLLADWEGDLKLGAMALRFFGGIHYLALSNRSPALAARLPSTGGVLGDEPWPVLLAAIEANEPLLKRALASPPQTNEVARSAVLLGGFLRVAQRTGLPLRLREVGASAGLNLAWDRYAYELGPHRWSLPGPALALKAEWQGGTPDLGATVSVASRAGCDLNPIDLTDADARLWLQAYIWPDQAQRLALTRQAIDNALAMGITVEKASAAAWTADPLAGRPAGQATVIYHSVVMQYFPPAEREAFIAALSQAGTAATTETPLAWLRMEYDAAMNEFVLRLTLWPDGEETLLALAHPHGRSIEWRG